MIFTSPNTSLQLKASQTLGVREAQGARVVCDQGILWLTQEGDSRDIFLRAGEEWVIELNGLVLIQALDEAAIKILSRTAVALPKAAPTLINKTDQQISSVGYVPQNI